MFGPTRYLQWAARFYGKARFDLATSGVPTAAHAELALSPEAPLDDCSGPERLATAIARYNGVPREEVAVALGTTHALWLAYSSLLAPGDEVLVEEPAYEPLVRIAEGLGAHVSRFARASSDRFALDPERVARALSPRTRAICVTSLHNPSGVRATDEALRAVATLAEGRGACLIVDEVYAPFDALVDEHGLFSSSARRLGPNVIAVSSLTKCYGLGPLRVGWMLAPREITARAADAILAACGALPTAHAYLALRAFERLDIFARRARSHLGAVKRARVAAWAQRLGFRFSAPQEGTFGLVEVPGAQDLTPLIERIAEAQQVLVAAGAFFGLPSAFRLAWTVDEEALDEGLARLAAALPARRGCLSS